MTITRPTVIQVPIDEDPNSGESYISSNDQISHKDPRCNDRFVTKLKKNHVLFIKNCILFLPKEKKKTIIFIKKEKKKK